MAHSAVATIASSVAHDQPEEALRLLRQGEGIGHRDRPRGTRAGFSHARVAEPRIRTRVQACDFAPGTWVREIIGSLHDVGHIHRIDPTEAEGRVVIVTLGCIS